MGVLTAGRIVNVLGAIIEKGENLENFANRTPVSNVISEQDVDRVFTIKSKNLTVQEALDLFYHNRRLLAIVITKNGSNLERPIGILTTANTMDLNKVVEDYEV